MNLFRVFAACLSASLLFLSCAPRTSIVWIEGETDPSTGQAVHTIKVMNPPHNADWTVWCAANHIVPTAVEGSCGVLEHFTGCLYKVTPTEKYEDVVVVRYAAKPIPRQCWAPEGFSLEVKGAKPVALETEYVFLPAEDVPNYPYNKVQLAVTDMIPALKSVKALDGTTAIAEVSTAIVEGQRAGWYRITIDGACKVEAADEDGAFYARTTIENLKRNAGGNVLPNMVIEDWPDLPYRGFMLDVSRNFTKKEGILKLIDLLAHYKATVLHLHLGDDEGWRVEIEGLPELTSYGAHHELQVMNEDGSWSEPNYLMPSFNGGIDPKDDDSSCNGFYSKEDFIEILKYAWERRIRILPEFDTPGHSRAAIKSMEAYYRRTGDASYLLSEPEDESEYCSVQYYVDNAINVALPSTYNFIAKVFDTLIEYYREAGAPLEQIHIGGDEVPEGAWEKSPACMALMEANGWDNVSMLKSYYIGKCADIAAERGVKLAGWQELVLGLEPAVFDKLLANCGTINFWSTHESRDRDQLPYRYANKGVKAVLSNMTNCYMDFAYNYSKLERGHSWGGFVDERRSFSLLPYDIYRSVRWDDYGEIRDIATRPEGKTALECPENIAGVQGQLWAETIRCFDHVTYYIFPKITGLFERGWNASPVWQGTLKSDDEAFLKDLDRFTTIVIEREMPYYEQEGISYRKRD